MSPLLALLGVLCILVGFVLFVVGGFRVSVLWGLIVLFLPGIMSFAVGIAGASMDLMKTDWWIWVALLVPFLPWLVFMGLHWEKAKNGFLLYIAGCVFFAAAVMSIDADTKKKIGAVALASAAKSGQPIPPLIADWLGIKPPATADKPGAPGAPNAKPGTPDAAAKPDAVVATPPGPAAPAGLESVEQVTAAVVELNDRAAKLKARKEMLKGSPDQLALAALTEDIRLFNERLKVVTARQVELKMIAAPPPTPTPGPVIPPTVVIPPSTPAPQPPRKK